MQLYDYCSGSMELSVKGGTAKGRKNVPPSVSLSVYVI